MHNRLRPKKHAFAYNIFMFWLDLDEPELLARKLFPFSYNRFNVFAFYDKDHMKYPENANTDLTAKQRVLQYLKKNNIAFVPDKIFLLTHTRVLGYIFNPVSFYFCYDNAMQCKMVVTEVGNTFGEMKIFIVDRKQDGALVHAEDKFFYVSPFTDLDNQFQFRFQVPGDKLHLEINVSDKQNVFFYSLLTGTKKALNTQRLILYFFRFPLITLQVISAIHWQAFKLWLKKIPYHAKSDNPYNQRDIVNPKTKING